MLACRMREDAKRKSKKRQSIHKQLRREIKHRRRQSSQYIMQANLLSHKHGMAREEGRLQRSKSREKVRACVCTCG